jgi:hypothetical protein
LVLARSKVKKGAPFFEENSPPGIDPERPQATDPINNCRKRKRFWRSHGLNVLVRSHPHHLPPQEIGLHFQAFAFFLYGSSMRCVALQNVKGGELGATI